MGLEGEPIVIIRRCCLGRCLRFILHRCVILPVRAEIDVADVQLYGDPLRAALVVIRSDAEVSHSGHKVARGDPAGAGSSASKGADASSQIKDLG